MPCFREENEDLSRKIICIGLGDNLIHPLYGGVPRIEMRKEQRFAKWTAS